MTWQYNALQTQSVAFKHGVVNPPFASGINGEPSEFGENGKKAAWSCNTYEKQ